ncbi:OmpA family protein [Aureispira sp. CCB-E]|uniref:OmpA family protein n=1 Tax=Aureispira sp. CCB-E TaxID=3051121 RepID=UPI002868FC11|nr:OmpA family protein [Aureispira sp. CCB-E]WMX17402.1 OmpA family protein [Aureispira sp. CCB-E]
MNAKFTLVLIVFFIYLSTTSAQRKRYLLLYSEAIYFNSGSAKILPKFRATLKEAAEAINSDKEARAWIQAHTDSLGSYESNQALSDRRADAVYKAFFEMGVDSLQLKIDSHGEYVPLKSNGTATGRALNRRVTIEVVRPYVPKEKEASICVVKGKVVDATNNQPLRTRLIFNSLAGKDTIETDEYGAYEYQVEMETNVEVRAYTKGYFFVSKLAKTKHKTTTKLDFNLEPAIIGGKMALNDLYFQGGTPLLMNASEKALEGVVAFMKYNSNLKIEIGGHINKPNQAPVPQSSSSFKLSEARAKVVHAYLIEHGISPDRLTYKGYGNSEMIHPRASNPVQEQMNRRVELKVIE